jgi:hypothetical protein
MEPLNPDLLMEIEEFAYLYLSKTEIALVTGLSDETKLSDTEDPAGIAFLKGRIRRKAQFHKSITSLSDQLSSPAMAIENKLALETFLNDSKS